MGHIPMYTIQMSLNNIITCYWHLTSGILDLYLWDLWHNTLSCSPLTYDICATLLNHFTCLFMGFHIVSLFSYCESNSDYMNSDYCDVRCWVYIWGFSCLDYFFDVLISQIGIWACITDLPIVTLLTVSFHVHMCLYSRDTFHVHVCLICTPLGLISCTRWVASDNPRPVCSDFEAWSIVDPSAAIRVAQRKLRRHRCSFLPALLLIGSQDSSCCLWAPLSFWLCISLCKL